MDRTTWCTAAVAGVVLLTGGGAAAAPDARHLEATPVAAPLGSAVLLRHAVQPVLAADDGGGLLLAAQAGGTRDSRTVLAGFRGPGGRWSRVVVLARGAVRGAPVVAAGGHGRALVGYSSSSAAGTWTASVRLRDRSGRWSAPRVLVRDRDVAALEEADMNRHGGVALLAAKGYSGHRVLSRPGGGSWRSTRSRAATRAASPSTTAASCTWPASPTGAAARSPRPGCGPWRPAAR